MIEIPEIVAALIAAAGEDTVLAFLEAHGGTRLWVPRNPLKSQLCGMYGDELAITLSRELLHGWWNVPMLKGWRVVCYRNAGMTLSEIATRVGLSMSQVERLLAQARRDGVHVRAARRFEETRQISLDF